MPIHGAVGSLHALVIPGAARERRRPPGPIGACDHAPRPRLFLFEQPTRGRPRAIHEGERYPNAMLRFRRRLLALLIPLATIAVLAPVPTPWLDQQTARARPAEAQLHPPLALAQPPQPPPVPAHPPPT